MIHKCFGRLEGPGKTKAFSWLAEIMKCSYLPTCLQMPPTHLYQASLAVYPVSSKQISLDFSFWCLGEQEAAHIVARSELHVLSGRPTKHADLQGNRLKRIESFWVHAAAFSTPGALIWVPSLLTAAKFHSNCRNLTLWPLPLYQMQLKLSSGFESY